MFTLNTLVEHLSTIDDDDACNVRRISIDPKGQSTDSQSVAILSMS